MQGVLVARVAFRAARLLGPLVLGPLVLGPLALGPRAGGPPGLGPRAGGLRDSSSSRRRRSVVQHSPTVRSASRYRLAPRGPHAGLSLIPCLVPQALPGPARAALGRGLASRCIQLLSGKCGARRPVRYPPSLFWLLMSSGVLMTHFFVNLFRFMGYGGQRCYSCRTSRVSHRIPTTGKHVCAKCVTDGTPTAAKPA